jgi:hypothetical protein
MIPRPPLANNSTRSLKSQGPPCFCVYFLPAGRKKEKNNEVSNAEILDQINAKVSLDKISNLLRNLFKRVA